MLRMVSGRIPSEGLLVRTPVATIGVRGLSESEIKTAKADMRELKRMRKFSSDKKRMKDFINKGNLTARKVPFLPSENQ